ncbi:hypothetical protein IQ249_09795 [Lusitaniella coriacea LEGE 07157]|uniref:Uncharacterized protein n=1 Tax=Lusitaniella coriacea LEGE 07157 TaxID=945747 RepID=A0A8J7DW83_9CYAN|nr:hypothetical protein [Lusitaniella coriacea]MBE9116187.1 hypothetical protein [Lusitaniella coriacea LEGE 07157]
MFSRKIALGLIALTLSLVTVLLPTTNAFSQDSPPVESPNTSQAELIVRDRGNIAINEVKFTRVDYVGQCPGNAYLPAKLEAQFVSHNTPPAANRRVVIKNVSKGLASDPYPFTDREYSHDRYSEGFGIRINYEHNSRNFSMIGGNNQLEYAIIDANKNPIEQGSFAVQVSINDRGTIQRDMICRDEFKCEIERRDDRENRICRTLTTCNCP